MNSRLLYLDGLRGLLAIFVVLHHLCIHRSIDALNKGWIPVDVFFILSGLIISKIYQKQIQTTTFYYFVSQRLKRLAPAYFIGLSIAFIELATRINPSEEIIFQVLSAILLLPNLGFNTTNILFPLNDPAWSLFFEIAVNIFFFFAIKNKFSIFLIIFSSLILYIYLSLTHGGLHGGWAVDNFVVGFPRVAYQFFIGVAIASYFSKYNPINIRFFFIATTIIISTFFFKNKVIEFTSVFFLAPIIVAIGYLTPNPKETNKTYAKLLERLGSISYPLYITHFPTIKILDRFEIGLNNSAHYLTFYLLMLISIAWCCYRFEEILRHQFSKRSKT